ncbi:C-type lectin domain family 2 member E-like [Vipera latastei]
MAVDEFEMIEKQAPGSNIRVQQKETDHTNIAMPNMDEEQELQHLSPNGLAGGQEKKPDNMQNGRYSRMRNLFVRYRSHIVIILLSSAIVVCTVLLANKETLKTDDSKSLPAPSQPWKRPCLPAWIGHQMKCFFFSNEESNWTAAQEFCSSNNASLAIIENEDLKVFVQRYKGSTPHWIGLKRDPGQPWKWINGNVSTWKVLGDGGNCAFLNDEGGASSSMCRTLHHWICIKPDEYTSPKIA